MDLERKLHCKKKIGGWEDGEGNKEEGKKTRSQTVKVIKSKERGFHFLVKPHLQCQLKEIDLMHSFNKYWELD